MKELRNEIVDRLATLIKKRRKGYEVIFLTKYAGSYHLYILDNDRPYANVQVFECLYSDKTLELNINKVEFMNCFITCVRLAELENICERVSKEYNELPDSLIIFKKALEPYEDIFEFLKDNYNFTCDSYDEDSNNGDKIEISNIKWVVKEQLESENE